MKPIILPEHYNYIAVFLTLRCNFNCPYCINKQGDFKIPPEMSKDDWVKGLSRIQTREDLPITLQGGEPTLYPYFYPLANRLYQEGKHQDLLTNGDFPISDFLIGVNSEIFKREAPYASIRFSYHGGDPLRLVNKVYHLQQHGYSVGIWGLSNQENKLVKHLCESLNVDFRVKQYLDEKHGTYKYPSAVGSSIGTHTHCKPSELLIAPDGFIYRCHADLYAARDSIGHILNEEIRFPNFLPCDNFGQCNPCDIKLKTDRFQVGGHCSVEIKETL
jgi:hypothetical protein